MAGKSILTVKEAKKLLATDKVMVSLGGRLRWMRIADLARVMDAPVADVVYDFRGGRNGNATVTDLTGGGNDATIINSAWNTTGSGYGDGGLRLDGVDDYVRLTEGCEGFKTVIMECKPASANGDMLYDQRNRSTTYPFAIYCENEDAVAYNGRNPGGSSYINGQLNSGTWLAKNLSGRRHVIGIANNTVTVANSQVPVIGGGNTDNYAAEMTVYRFFGFKRLLTAAEMASACVAYGLLEEAEGVNLLKGSATFDPQHISLSYGGDKSNVTDGGTYNGLSVKRITSNSARMFIGFDAPAMERTNFPTVISFYGRVVSNSNSVNPTFNNYTGTVATGGAKRMDGGSEWKQYFLYFQNGATFFNGRFGKKGNGFIEFSSLIGTIEVCGFKVERVNMSTKTPTPWTPAIGEVGGGK